MHAAEQRARAAISSAWGLRDKLALHAAQHHLDQQSGGEDGGGRFGGGLEEGGSEEDGAGCREGASKEGASGEGASGEGVRGTGRERGRWEDVGHRGGDNSGGGGSCGGSGGGEGNDSPGGHTHPKHGQGQELGRGHEPGRGHGPGRGHEPGRSYRYNDQREDIDDNDDVDHDPPLALPSPSSRVKMDEAAFNGDGEVESPHPLRYRHHRRHHPGQHSPDGGRGGSGDEDRGGDGHLHSLLRAYSPRQQQASSPASNYPPYLNLQHLHPPPPRMPMFSVY